MTRGRQIVAIVIDAQGEIQGYQTKNQLDPSEDQFYVAGNSRRLFESKEWKVLAWRCHEALAYPETVRWAAARAPKLVFHPQHTGSDSRRRPSDSGLDKCTYYERAMMMRSIEITIYFASVNYLLPSRSLRQFDAPRDVPGVLTLWPGDAYLCKASRRGSDRFAGQPIRTSSLPGIHTRLSEHPPKLICWLKQLL